FKIIVGIGIHLLILSGFIIEMLSVSGEYLNYITASHVAMHDALPETTLPSIAGCVDYPGNPWLNTLDELFKDNTTEVSSQVWSKVDKNLKPHAMEWKRWYRNKLYCLSMKPAEPKVTLTPQDLSN